MLKLAVYGKGGIGKSTITTNLAVALAEAGCKVMQIGCDPKADSTLALHQDHDLQPLLELIKDNSKKKLTDIVFQGEAGVYCVETGGPMPGLGCAGRGIGLVLEYLRQNKAIETLKIDAILFDVLGDVVCGGFSMPMREGYAKHVLIATSGEKMSLHAAKNISRAINNFQQRGYAQLAGLIFQDHGDSDEPAAVQELASKLNSEILATLPYSLEIKQAEKIGRPLVLTHPDSSLSQTFRDLAQKLLQTLN
ncbi:MAG: P-loop NTPase [Desulfovibrionaceae bacterium]|nr:P-loop NTPase [Desulfovibrionaceae bacterium]